MKLDGMLDVFARYLFSPRTPVLFLRSQLEFALLAADIIYAIML